jgi:protein arginine kinase activator
MICQICHKNQATIKFTHIINGVKSETYLCQKCAQEKGMNNPFLAMQPLLEQMILGMIQEKKKKAKTRAKYSQKICTGCGVSFQNFLDTGRLGCPKCYQAFREELKPLLRRIHGTTHHGPLPKKVKPKVSHRHVIEQLRRDLETAVQEEEFERAAVIRDRIKELNQKNNDTA